MRALEPMQRAVVNLLLAMGEIDRDIVLDMFCRECGRFTEEGEGQCPLCAYKEEKKIHE